MRALRELVLDLRANLSRSILGGLGLSLAVLALLAVTVAGSISRQVVVATAEQRYGRHITVAGQLSFAGLGTQQVDTALATIRRIALATGTSFDLTVQGGEVETDGRPDPASVFAVTGNLDDVRRVPLLHGHALPDLAHRYPAAAVLNEAAARRLGGVGTHLHLRPVADEPSFEVLVIGVVADGSVDADVYLSLSAMQAMRPSLLAQPVTLSLHSPSRSMPSLIATFQTMKSAVGLDPKATDVEQVDETSGLAEETRTVRTAFLVVALLGLVVASIGLLSLGLATVRERGRELTVRRALGATRGRVVVLMLVGNLAIGVLAAVAAIAVGDCCLVVLVPHVVPQDLEVVVPTFPWRPAGLACGVATAAAVASGVAPALLASRVDMAAALRA